MTIFYWFMLCSIACSVVLQFWKEKRRYMLVCMSAASNVTGIITDVDSVSKIAHKYGALVVYDYAAGGINVLLLITVLLGL